MYSLAWQCRLTNKNCCLARKPSGRPDTSVWSWWLRPERFQSVRYPGTSRQRQSGTRGTRGAWRRVVVAHEVCRSRGSRKVTPDLCWLFLPFGSFFRRWTRGTDQTPGVPSARLRRGPQENASGRRGRAALPGWLYECWIRTLMYDLRPWMGFHGKAKGARASLYF